MSLFVAFQGTNSPQTSLEKLFMVKTVAKVVYLIQEASQKTVFMAFLVGVAIGVGHSTT